MYVLQQNNGTHLLFSLNNYNGYFIAKSRDFSETSTIV